MLPAPRSEPPQEPRWWGVYPALVTNIQDPVQQGRVEVQLPWSPDLAAEASPPCVWARLVTLMAGPGRGTWFIPEVGDEVAVSFQGGDPRLAFVLGGLWNGIDKPPATMDDQGQNLEKSVTTKSGIQLLMNDKPDEQLLDLHLPGGDKRPHVTLKADPGQPYLELADASENQLRLDPGGVQLHDRNGEALTLASQGASAALKDRYDDSLTLSGGSAKLAANQSLSCSVAPNSVAIDTTSITLTAGAAKIALGPSGITLEFGGSQVSIGPAGVTVQAGGSSLGVTLTGISATAAASLSLTAPTCSVGALSISLGGMVQAPTITVGNLIGATVAPAAGNVL